MENHILVGLGGTGGKILREFKMRMFEEYPDEKERKSFPIALVYVDTTREMMGLGRPENNVLGQDAGFTEAEFLNIRDVNISAIIDSIKSYPNLKGVVDNVEGVRNAIGNLGEAAGQKRRAGRLLFAANVENYLSHLDTAFANLSNLAKSGTADKFVHIFTGLSGGTGSGAIVDTIAQTRKHWPDAKILVYAMLPERDLKAGVDKEGRYYPNAVAALRELNAMQAGAWSPYDITGNGRQTNFFNIAPSKKGVADGIALYSNINSRRRRVDQYTELPRIVSDFAYARIFQITNDVKELEDVYRAYNFENLDAVALEKDEKIDISEWKKSKAELPAVRTAKISSFGIKRILYPETRVLKHITYTVGDRLLNQIKFNNWTDSQGYINEPVNRDYRSEFLAEKQTSEWMLDMAHLMLEKKVLPTDEEFKPFLQDWTNRIMALSDTFADDDCPPEKMRDAMNKAFDANFRKVGAKKYYTEKTRVAREIAAEIRSKVEKDLYGRWIGGTLSLMDLAEITLMLQGFVGPELAENLSEQTVAIDREVTTREHKVSEIIQRWADSGFVFGKLLGHKKDIYAECNAELGKLMTARTRQEALKFAKVLQQNLVIEFNNMAAGVAAFLELTGNAIDATSVLLAAQKKKIPGLENINGPIVEVCEEEAMTDFERDMMLAKEEMRDASTNLRNTLVGDRDFISFGDLTARLSVEDFLMAFDRQLSLAVKTFHEKLPVTATKVLGLNILEQLMQKLDTDQKIKEFAKSLFDQTAPYIDLDDQEMVKSIPNADQIYTLGKTRKLVQTYVAFPNPAQNAATAKFADKLINAFKEVNGSITVHMGGSKDDELSIISISSGYPMRAIKWVKDDIRRYDEFLHNGSEYANEINSILLHGEGDGTQLPNITALDIEACEELYEKQRAEKPSPEPAPAQSDAKIPPMPGSVPPPPPGSHVPQADPVVNMRLAIGGQQYGPYDYATLKSFIPTGQLTADTYVWEEGMAAWTPAGQVEKLKGLFAPKMPDMPPMPPMPGAGAPPVPPMPGM